MHAHDEDARQCAEQFLRTEIVLADARHMALRQWTEIEARSVLEASKGSGSAIEKFARNRELVPQRLSQRCTASSVETGIEPYGRTYR